MGKAWGYNTALCSSSAPDATIALRLGQPGSSTVLAQLFHFPEACSIKVRRTELLQSSRGIPEELWLHAAQRHCRNSGGNTSDFLCYCSQHPTFLLKPPHHTTHIHTHRSPPLLAVLLTVFVSFFFPGCNQETIWEQRLPLRAGEWRSVVWVSTLLFPGTSLKPLVHLEALCSPPGLHCNVSVTRQTPCQVTVCLSATIIEPVFRDSTIEIVLCSYSMLPVSDLPSVILFEDMMCDLFQEDFGCLFGRCYRSVDGQSATLSLMKAVKTHVVNRKPPSTVKPHRDSGAPCFLISLGASRVWIN